MRKLWVDSSPAPPTTEAPTTTTTLPPTTSTAPSKDSSSFPTRDRSLAWSSDVGSSQWFCSNYYHFNYHNHYHTETDDYHNKHHHDQYHNDYHTSSHYHVQYVVPVMFSFLLYRAWSMITSGWCPYWMGYTICLYLLTCLKSNNTKNKVQFSSRVSSKCTHPT